MPGTTIVSNEFYELSFHEDEKIVHHTYKPDMDSAHLQELLSAGTDLLTQHGATKWLSDNRDLQVAFTEEDAAWVNNTWLPETIEAGWKYWAMVVPEALISQADHVQYVESFHGSGVWVTVYVDVESALNWLRSVDA